MRPIDINAQCLVEDGEGNWFLCPLFRRDEAIRHFETVYTHLADPDYVPGTFPPYLTSVEGPDRLHFFNAVPE